MIVMHMVINLVVAMLSLVLTIVVGVFLWAIAASLIGRLRERFRPPAVSPATEVALHGIRGQLELVQLKSEIRRDGHRLRRELFSELSSLPEQDD